MTTGSPKTAPHPLRASYTPGPWEVGGDEKGGEPGYVYCNNDMGSAVAIVFGIPALRFSVFPREEEEANARLIAAAPDLVEEAKADVAAFENLLAYLRKHAAKLPPFSTASIEVRVEKIRAALSKAGV